MLSKHSFTIEICCLTNIPNEVYDCLLKGCSGLIEETIINYIENNITEVLVQTVSMVEDV